MTPSPVVRFVGSWIAWVVAVVIGVVTVPALWVSEHVADEDGWVEFTSGFVRDDALRDGVVDAAATAALTRTNLPAELIELMQDALRDLVRTAVERPGFVDAWRESLRLTHQLTFGPTNASGASAGRLVADIGPLATFVARDVSEQLPVRLTVPAHVEVPLQKKPNPGLVDRVTSSPTKSLVGLVVTGVALLVSMALAGGTAGALRRFGLAFVAVGAALLAATTFVLPHVLDQADGPSAFARQLRDLLVTHASGSLNAWALTLVVVGALATAGGLAGSVGQALRQRAARRRP